MSGQLQANWLVYDIPEKSGYPNPTGWLLPIAVRVNKSCWVILGGDIPWVRLHDMKTAGVKYYVIPFAPEAAQDIVNMAVDTIRADLRDAVQRARESVARANDNLETGEYTTPAANRREYERQARAIVRKARKFIADIRTAAAKFGITDQMISLSDASTSVAAIQVSVERRARIYSEAVDSLRSIMGPRDAMVVAAGTGTVDGRIVADYLDDNGGNGRAVRDAFS